MNISSDGGSALVGLTGTGQVDAGAGTAIVISEFRTRGADGGNDEFIELYNNTDAPIAIGGYKLRGSNAAGTIGDRATVLAGTILPARGHFLFVNGAAGSSARRACESDLRHRHHRRRRDRDHACRQHHPRSGRA